MIKEAEIGIRIKQFRKLRKLTLQGLANYTGFSKGYLSKLEKSVKAPPISTLGKIAKVLGVSIAVLLGEERHNSPISITRKHERPLVAERSALYGYSYQAVAPRYPNRRSEPYILTLPPKVKYRGGMFQHDGEELLFVLQGRMKFQYGDEEHIMEVGDSAYFDASVPHLALQEGTEKTKCLCVIIDN